MSVKADVERGRVVLAVAPCDLRTPRGAADQFSSWQRL